MVGVFAYASTVCPQYKLNQAMTYLNLLNLYLKKQKLQSQVMS